MSDLLRPLVLAALVVSSAAAGAASPRSASAQTSGDFPPDTFLDERARELFGIARARWLDVDRSILSYDAVSLIRMGVYLRGFIKDRTLFEAESARRIRWSADSTLVVQAIGSAGRTAAGELPLGEIVFTEAVFDPTSDRIFFGAEIEPEPEADAETPENGDTDPEAADAADGGEPAGGDSEDDDDSSSIEFGIEHPVAPGAEEHYRYRTADSVTLTLPDGRSVRAVGLELVPRQRSARLVSGRIWVEPESGAVVRALFRLSTRFDLERELADEDVSLWMVPGMFQPIEFDVSMVTIEYGLWDFEHWMPARLRLEGYTRAGVLRVPFEMEQTYRILDVVDADDAVAPEPPEAVVARWLEDGRYGDSLRAYAPDELEDADNPYAPAEDDDREPGGDDQATPEDEDDGLRVYLVVPADPEDLRSSELLPPRVGRDATGFASADELDEIRRELSRLPVPEVARHRFGFDHGPELGELTRYNRVEGLALGARASWSGATGIGPAGADLRGWFGIGSGTTDLRLELWRESPFRRFSIAGYHRVDEVEPLDRGLGVGNSLEALLWGIDDGDYFRASGARLRVEPIGVRRPWYHFTLSAERHRPLAKEVDFSVAGLLGGEDAPFRPGLEADEVTEYAAALGLEPWWGTDPRGIQGGVEALVHAATGAHDEGGSYEWLRSRFVARLATPLPLGVRGGVEAGYGRVWGDAPLQRNWFLGGARTLRGYGGAAAVGDEFVRGRVELARSTSFARLSLFSDAGWAGESGAFDADDALVSAGLGVSLMDGLIRFDLARALRAPTGWRFEAHVDSFF